MNFEEKRLNGIPISHLAESLSQDPTWLKSKYFLNFKEKQIAKEKLYGTQSNTDLQSTTEVLAQIVKGYEAYGNVDAWVRPFITDKSVTYIPVSSTGSAVDITTGSGVFTNQPMTVGYRAVTNSTEIGSNVVWTRGYAEDASFDAFAMQNEDAGIAIKRKVLADVLTLIQACSTGSGVGSATVTGFQNWSGSAPLFSQILGAISKVDQSGYGPATHMLLNTDQYWLIFDNEKMTSTLYAGNDIKQGTISTTLGVDFVKVDSLSGSTANQKDYAIALNKDKAVALVTRRGLTVEPYERPETNSYGFVASMKIKPVILITGSICRCFTGA